MIELIRFTIDAMASVYLVRDNGKTEAMNPVRARNEDRELQCLLLNNYDLLPGDQIDPETPIRWMLVKREMPVPDPQTGAARYNIDFLFVDQDATPTFIECKRYLDTRTRREAIGQVLEYVANAKDSWSGDDLRRIAEGETADFSQVFGKLQPKVDSAEDFFEEVERRLKAGEVRIVFFMDEAPVELKKLVEFLNGQMSLMEVILVEARQFEKNGSKVVVPTLFGFTEQIRVIKRQASSQRDGQTVAVDWEGFATNAQQKGLNEDEIGRLRRVYDACVRLHADLAWGRGRVIGSFSPRWRSISDVRAAPFSVHADGNLGLHLPAYQASTLGKQFATTLVDQSEQGGLMPPKDSMTTWCSWYRADWLPKVEVFIAALEKAVQTIAQFQS